MRNYHITDHAVDRFIERAKNVDGHPVLKKPRRLIRRLLKDAKVALETKERKTKRMMHKNRMFKPVFYLENNGWRFVISQHDNTVVTAERINPLEN